MSASIIDRDSIVPFTLTSLLGTSLTAAFKVINTSGFDYPCGMVRIVNNTAKPVMISYDGYYDHEFIDSNDELDINFQTNNSPNNKKSFFEKGTNVYVKKVTDTPKSGSVYLIAYN